MVASNASRCGPPVHCAVAVVSVSKALVSGSGASYTANAASGRAGSDGACVSNASSNAPAAS